MKAGLRVAVLTWPAILRNIHGREAPDSFGAFPFMFFPGISLPCLPP